MSRANYQRAYYRGFRASGTPLAPDLPLYWPGRLPHITKNQYEALKAWRRSPRVGRKRLWEIAEDWGTSVGYLESVLKRGIARYELDLYAVASWVREFCAAVDEARAQP